VGDGLGELEVVVKAIADRRPDGEFRPGEEAQHRLGQDVGRRVPQDLQGLGVRERQRPDLPLRGEGIADVAELPVVEGPHHLIGEPPLPEQLLEAHPRGLESLALRQDHFGHPVLLVARLPLNLSAPVSVHN